MSAAAYIELDELTQSGPDLKSPGSAGQTGSPSFDCSRHSPSCSPQTVMNTSFDSGFHQPLAATSGGQLYSNGDMQSMGQCIRSAYGELYTDQDSFASPAGPQIPTSPECGYRGGEMPSSPSSQSDISSCISTGETWVGNSGNQQQNHRRGSSGSPYPLPPPPPAIQTLPLQSSPTNNNHLNVPTVFQQQHLHQNHTMSYPTQASNINPQQQQHHTYTTEQQVPPHLHHTMLPGYDTVSPGQLVTVPTQRTCQVNPFDVAAFPGFVMGHNKGNNNATNIKPKRKRIINKVQRKAANIRERKRMFSLNEAFDELRTKIPKFSYEKKMSRIETLRLAITYISFMSDVVQGVDPSDVQLPQVNKSNVMNFENMNFQF